MERDAVLGGVRRRGVQSREQLRVEVRDAGVLPVEHGRAVGKDAVRLARHAVVRRRAGSVVARDAAGAKDVYILRLEQFYPFPAQSLSKELGRFKDAEIVWCQEEPKNQGAWSFVEPNLEWVLSRINARHTRPRYVGRNAAASPATGLASRHKAEQEALVGEAITIEG